MELNRLYEVMDSSFEAQVMYNNSPVLVESIHGDMARVKYLTDKRSAEVPVADLSEVAMPIAENEYITDWLTRTSPIIRG